MTNSEKEQIKLNIDKFFIKNKASKLIKIISWNYTFLIFYCWTLLMLALTIWFFINLAILNQKTVVNIVLLTIFLLFTILSICLIVLTKKIIKKYNKNFVKQYYLNLEQWYKEIINANLQAMKLKKIDTVWSIMPNINFYYKYNINNLDYVLLLENKQKNKINIGTLTQTSNVPLNNKTLTTGGFNPNNLNQYQYFLLTIKITSSSIEPITLIPQQKIKKNHNDEINNFYQTKITNQQLETQIISNIKDTKLIPSINYQNQTLTLCFATILTNNIKDNYDSFFSFNFTFNKKLLYLNTIELINKDLTKIQLFLHWLNLIDYIK